MQNLKKIDRKKREKIHCLLCFLNLSCFIFRTEQITASGKCVLSYTDEQFMRVCLGGAVSKFVYWPVRTIKTLR